MRRGVETRGFADYQRRKCEGSERIERKGEERGIRLP